MRMLADRRAARAWAFFSEICAIPHGSGDEKALSDWLMDFAKTRGLWAKQDDAYNVVVKKPGYPGYGDHPPVILQSHIDMVCEKNRDKSHDFLTDPIQTVVEGDFVRADGTTLGADNGVGVAFILAVLDSADLPHPPLEAVFSTGEEVGMTGAGALDMDCLEGETLINIDAEEEGVFVVSSAGGLHFNMRLPTLWREAPKDYSYRDVRICGLKGGHSGIDIAKGLGNSNLLLARALDSLQAETDIALVSFDGGLKDNAIPRESQAVVGVRDAAAADEVLKRMAGIFQRELSITDPEVQLQWAAASAADEAFSDEAAGRLIQLLILLPHGVQAMSRDIEGLVEASNSPGVVTTTGDQVCITNIARSSVESRKELLHRQALALAKVVGAEVEVTGSYPAWAYIPESGIRDLFMTAYEKLFHKKPEISALHAGLECSVFARKRPGADILSIGPNLYDAHSPKERVSVSSVDRTWTLVLEVLKQL